jgi:hypothetical protein
MYPYVTESLKFQSYHFAREKGVSIRFPWRSCMLMEWMQTDMFWLSGFERSKISCEREKMRA